MSFSVSVDRGAFEYRARLAGLAAQPSNLFRPRYLRMIREIVRFTREAKTLGAADRRICRRRRSCERGGYSEAFRDDFLLPMVACIWSSHLEEMLSYPAATMAGFLDNHGLLDLGDRPQWRTVSGRQPRVRPSGSASSLSDVRTDTPVLAIDRGRDDVLVRRPMGSRPGTTTWSWRPTPTPRWRSSATDASALERRVLRSFRYQENRRRPPPRPLVHAGAPPGMVQLELPRAGAASPTPTGSVSLTYWMNLLQNLDTERPVFVTLNPADEPRDVEASFTYHHPQFDRDAVDAQPLIPSIQGDAADVVRGQLLRATGSMKTGCDRGCRSRRRSAPRRRGGGTTNGIRERPPSGVATMAGRRRCGCRHEPARVPAAHRARLRACTGAGSCTNGSSPRDIASGTGSGTCSPTSMNCRRSTHASRLHLQPPWAGELLGSRSRRSGRIAVATVDRTAPRRRRASTWRAARSGSCASHGCSGTGSTPSRCGSATGPIGDLRALLYEVSNTFGEWHDYLVPVTSADVTANERGASVRTRFAKELFVSPFIDMDATYDFTTREPDQRVSVVVRETDRPRPASWSRRWALGGASSRPVAARRRCSATPS